MVIVSGTLTFVWVQAGRLNRRGVVRPKRRKVANRFSEKSNYMFRNYSKIAWRNIIRHKTYSVINVAGLAVGFAAFLLIFLVVRYEQSFDQFHAHKNQL